MGSVFKTPEGEREVLTFYEGLLRHWPVAGRQHRLTTRFGETFVMDSGALDLPALVLLHGTAANAASWIADVELLSAHFRVLCVDIIGDAGLSTQVRPSFATDAHAQWLNDVLDGLQLRSAAFMGTSLGGYLALDYATRCPDRVTHLIVLNPGGVGRHRNILLWALPLLMLGPWGRRKMLERIGGPAPAVMPPEGRAILDLSGLIFRHFKPRTEALPQVDDEALRRLTMPVLAILGGKDVFVDNQGTKERLEASVSDLTIDYWPKGYHFIPAQGARIVDFILGRADRQMGREREA